MKNITQHFNFINTCKLLIVVGLLSFGALYATAFTPPTTSPTGGNVAAPINTGSVTQTKTGNLGANRFIGLGGTFMEDRDCTGYDPDNVPSPLPAQFIVCLLGGSSVGNNFGGDFKGLRTDGAGNIFISDGNEAPGKVLTSNANGMATWSDLSEGGLPSPANNNDTMRYNGITEEWERTDILQTFSLATGLRSVQVSTDRTGLALMLSNGAASGGSAEDVEIAFYPHGGNINKGARLGFFDNSITDNTGAVPNTNIGNVFHVNNSLGELVLHADEGVYINPNSNSILNQVKVGLDVNGDVRIRGRSTSPTPVSGQVLTAVDSSGRAEWRDAPTTTTNTSNLGNIIRMSNSSSATATVSCDGTGHPILAGGGGGCGHNNKLEASYPDVSNNGWYVRCGGTRFDTDVYAICMKQ